MSPTPMPGAHRGADGTHERAQSRNKQKASAATTIGTTIQGRKVLDLPSRTELRLQEDKAKALHIGAHREAVSSSHDLVRHLAACAKRRRTPRPARTKTMVTWSLTSRRSRTTETS